MATAYKEGTHSGDVADSIVCYLEHSVREETGLPRHRTAIVPDGKNWKPQNPQRDAPRRMAESSSELDRGRDLAELQSHGFSDVFDRFFADDSDWKPLNSVVIPHKRINSLHTVSESNFPDDVFLDLRRLLNPDKTTSEVILTTMLREVGVPDAQMARLLPVVSSLVEEAKQGSSSRLERVEHLIAGSPTGQDSWAERVGHIRATTSLPAEAPALWKQDKQPGDTPVTFIQRHYEPWLGKGLSRPDIKRLDPSLYMGLANWLRHHELPEDFDLPTKRETVSAQIETSSDAGPAEITAREYNRIARARWRRAHQQK